MSEKEKSDVETLYVLIAGSRDIPLDRDYPGMIESAIKLQNFNYDKIIEISGTAIGADSIGETWAELNGHEVLKFPADWKHQGRGAGMIRNKKMFDFIYSKKQRIVILFWNGESNGAKFMKKLCESADNMRYHIYYIN